MSAGRNAMSLAIPPACAAYGPWEFGARGSRRFLYALHVRPVLVVTIYDPTFRDDQRAFIAIEPGAVRAAHRQFNAAPAAAATRVGALVDVHRHFLSGEPGWFVETIEPNLVGASEIRSCFWPAARRVALELATT